MPAGRVSPGSFALVIGGGSAGTRHAAIISDVIPRLRVQHIGARAADSYFLEDLADDLPQFAVIASPATNHPAFAERLLALGVPVLIEKPLAVNASAARHLIEVARAQRVSFQVGYVMRFYPEIRIIRALLEDNAIGDLLFAEFQVGQYLPDWRPGRDYRDSVSATSSLGGGVLLELSHEIDTALGLFGSPRSVACSAEKIGQLEIDVEDFADITLWFDTRPHQPRRVEIRMDFLRRHPSRTVQIHGAEGIIHWDAIQHKVSVFRSESRAWEPQEVPFDEQPSSYHSQLQSFLKSLEHPVREPKIDVQAIKVMEIIDSCRSSIGLGGAKVSHRDGLV